MRTSKSLLGLLGFGAAVAGAAWFGSRYNPRDLRTRIWYQGLNKPTFNPPNYVFPIVWSSLYALIAFSGWRVWQGKDSPERSRALRLWASQLAANAEWSKLFFESAHPAEWRWGCCGRWRVRRSLRRLRWNGSTTMSCAARVREIRFQPGFQVAVLWRSHRSRVALASSVIYFGSLSARNRVITRVSR
jgi:TspO/MBR family